VHCSLSNLKEEGADLGFVLIVAYRAAICNTPRHHLPLYHGNTNAVAHMANAIFAQAGLGRLRNSSGLLKSVRLINASYWKPSTFNKGPRKDPEPEPYHYVP